MADDLGDDWWVVDNKESVSELDKNIHKGTFTFAGFKLNLDFFITS